MSCLNITPKIEKLAKKFPNMEEREVANLVGIWQEENGKSVEDVPSDSEFQDFIKKTRNTTTFKWARAAENGYEVSTRGDKRFSAFVATFKEGTIIDGVDVGGRTIEDVYQTVIKKSRKGQAPSKGSKLYRTSVSSYIGNVTPDANTIFVFGSNPEGRHGAGAARVAREQFGAIYGQGEGLQGNAYALPTKDLRVKGNRSLRSIPPEQIIESIKKLYEAARQNPNKQFKVAYRNTDKASLNGYTGLEMIDMFLKAGSIPTNIVFSKEWVDTGKFNLSREELEDFSYTEGYLPLWQEWAKQNPELMDELRAKSAGKTLTDQFANTRVSQARALADILNSQIDQTRNPENGQPSNTSSITPTEQTPIMERKVTIEDQRAVDLIFDPKVRRDRVSLIARLFSVKLDAAVEEKKKELQDQIDTTEDQEERLSLQLKLKNLTRADVINEYKPIGIFREVYKLFRDYVEDTDENRIQAELDALHQRKGIEKYTEEQILEAAKRKAAYKLQEYKKLTDDEMVFKSLAEEASLSLLYTEGLLIDPNYMASTEVSLIQDISDETTNSDDFVDDYTSGETTKEGWMMDPRLTSSSEGLSQKVRSVLMKIPRYGHNGKIEKDDLGFARYLLPNYTHAVLIDKLRNMVDSDDMIPMLQELQKSKPWVKRIVKLLQEDETLFSQFYSNFRKDFLSYYIQKRIENPDGTVQFKTVQVNRPEGTNYLLEQWRDNHESSTMLDDDSVYTQTGELSVENAQKGLKLTEELNNKFARLSTEERLSLLEDEDVQDSIMKLLHMIGIDINPDTLKTSLTNIKSAPGITFTDPIMLLLPNLNVIFSKIAKKQVKSEIEGELPSSIDLINTFGSAYNSIAQIFNEVTEDAIESSSRENGKTYYAHTPPSYLGKLIKKLKNVRGDKAKFDKFIQEEFGKYEWFRKKGSWLNDWLDQLTKSQKMREGLDHKILLNSGKVEYDQWDSLDYTLVLLNEYLGDPSGNKSNIKWAWYHVPILSDSKSAEFIRFRRYTTGDVLDENGRKRTYDDVILDKLTDLVTQEYNRIMLVRERGEKIKNGDKSIIPIKNFDIVYEGDEIKSKGGSEFKFLPILNQLEYNGKSFLDGIIELKEKGTGAELKEFIRNGLRDAMDQEFESAFATWKSVGLLDKASDNKYKYLSFETQSSHNSRMLQALNSAKEILGNSWNTRMEVLRRDIENDNAYSTRKAENTIEEIKQALAESVAQGKAQSQQIDTITKSLFIKDNAKDALREYFWNSTLATSQIIQLTTTDLAYYKNLEDFQKRYKEVHAGTSKLNTKATYKGKQIGREWERTIYIKDEIVVSDVINDIKEVLDTKVAANEMTSLDRDFILSQYRKVNVTDAQAYRSMSSYRAMLGMQGQWTDEMEDAYQHFKDGHWSIADFMTIWQTKKPFLYTQVEKIVGYNKKQVPLVDENTGEQVVDSNGNPRFIEVDDTKSPIYQKVPVQHKNSEFLLLAMHNLIAGPLGKSSKLVAINKFMEAHQIDVVQFNSTVKVGEQGAIDLSGINDEKEIIEKLQEETQAGTALENPDVVHKVPYEDYGIITATPEHFIGQMQLVGTQIRKLIAADIPENAQITVDGQVKTKKEWIDLYNKINTENIIESFSQTNEIFKDPKEVEKILQDEIRRNPRYGNDLKKACTLTDKGTFNIPLYDPVQTIRVQSLLNSVIKSRITKQKIKGGSLLQVSCYGLTDQLHIVFEGKGENKRIKYIECYLPAYSKELYEPLMDPKTHQLDVSKLPKELRKAVGYRIPTESHYSMAPLYIKGFLPQQNGSAIMLPAEITTIAGSDFDADKLYVMIPEFNIIRYNKEAARRDYAKVNPTFNQILSKFSNNDLLKETLSTDTADFNEWYNKHKEDYKLPTPIIEKVKYNHNKSPQENSRAARNNLLIDMMYGILTNPNTASKILNPGGFNYQKRAARIVTLLNALTEDQLAEALQNAGVKLNKTVVMGTRTYKKSIASYLFDLDDDTLDELAAKYKQQMNPLSPTTQVYLHHQNMSGAQLIAIYANHNANHALMQYTELELNEHGVFTLNGKQLSSLHSIMNNDKEFISKNTAGFLAAAVDNVKDPVLASLNQNTFTADATMLLSRLGYNPIEIGLLMSQPIIMDITKAYFRQYKEGKSKETIIKEVLEKYEKKAEASYDLTAKAIGVNRFSIEDLAENLLIAKEATTDRSSTTDLRKLEYYKNQVDVGYLFMKILKSADALSQLTQATRADTPKGAAGPTIANTVIKIQRVRDFEKAASQNPKFPLRNYNVISTDMISPNDSIDTIRQKLLNSRLPYLQAFYSLGMEWSINMMGKYFPQLSPSFMEVIDSLRAMTRRGTLDVGTMNSIYNDLLAYTLSKTEFFGKEGIRDHFINSFPDEFDKIVSQNPDIANLGFIKRLRVIQANKYNPVRTIVFKNVGRLTPSLKEGYMRDWEYMLHMNNPVANKLALDLFRYSYYRNGLSFGPSSFINLAPTALRRAVPDYITTLEALLTSEDDYSQFVDQYVYNHLNNRKLVPSISKDNYVRFTDTEGNIKDEVTIKVGQDPSSYDSEFILGSTIQSGVPVHYFLEYIGKMVNNNWVYYKKSSEGILEDGSQVVTYTRIKPLGYVNSFIEYEYGKDAEEIESVISYADKKIDAAYAQQFGFDTGEAQIDYGTEPNRFEEAYSESNMQAVQNAYKQVYGEPLQETGEPNSALSHTPNSSATDAEGNQVCGSESFNDSNVVATF